MERIKVKLKKEYKKLVRAGKLIDADKKLAEYWKLCGIVKPGVVKSTKVSKPTDKYTKESLEALSFKELKVIGLKFGTTDRSKVRLIKEILDLQ